MRNYKIYVEIVPPSGERIIHEQEIEGHVFREGFKAIHYNKNPLFPDPREERRKSIDSSKSLLDLISNSITDVFGEYFETKDTIDGELKKDRYEPR